MAHEASRDHFGLVLVRDPHVHRPGETPPRRRSLLFSPNLCNSSFVALNVKHPEADRLARELARETGESLTDAIIGALSQRLERERRRGAATARERELRAIAARVAAMPVVDGRSGDDILYDELGLPG